MTNQALTDAIASAKMHLREEEAAATVCRDHGWMTDLRFAESEVVHFRALLARLEAKRDAS